MPPAWTSFPGPKKLRSIDFRKSADNDCKGNAAIAYRRATVYSSLRSFPMGDNAFTADPLRTLVRLCRVVDLPMRRRFCPRADSPIRPWAVTFHCKVTLGTRFFTRCWTARHSGLATNGGL